MATNDAKNEGVTKGDAETVARSENNPTVNANATVEELTGSVDVVLIGVGWTRPGTNGERTRTYKRGARLTVTEAEWKLLGPGSVKPTLREANEDD